MEVSYRVGQSFAGPCEIKRREVSWTLTKKLDSFEGPGETKEGGGAGPSREPRRHHEQGGGAVLS